MKKALRFFSDINLKKYDTFINIILIILSLMLLAPIIQFLLNKEDLNNHRVNINRKYSKKNM